MQTVYDAYLSLSENELKWVYCDLEHQRIYYKDKLVFDRGIFVNTKNADELNRMPLLSDTSYKSQEIWCAEAARLYDSYSKSYPQHVKRYWFIPASKASEVIDRFDFHHKRIALELYILFSAVLHLLAWDNPDYFMIKPCKGCIVYRDWVNLGSCGRD